ncbi:MIP/aquaporin family protein [Streptomyces flaveolus]|uniref:hypothetical protein n=1 Tax=Streptomyces flaveolus TaxID=67297 RepID=UPI0036FCED51
MASLAKYRAQFRPRVLATLTFEKNAGAPPWPAATGASSDDLALSRRLGRVNGLLVRGAASGGAAAGIRRAVGALAQGVGVGLGDVDLPGLLAGASDPHLVLEAHLAPLLVASYIGAAYWFTSSTSFANPAVTIGRAFTDTFAGIAPTSVLPFLAAQLVGSAAGLGLVAVCFGRPAIAGEDEVVVPHAGQQPTARSTEESALA